MGPRVARELEDWEATRVAIKSGTEGREGVQIFVDEGRWLYSNLQSLVHDEPLDERFSHRKAAKWLRFSRRSRKAFGRKVLHDALGTTEWLQTHEPD